MNALGPTLESLLGPEGLAPCIVMDKREIPVAAPEDENSLLETLVLARANNLRVIPIGRGSRVAHLRPGESPNFFLSTRRLTGILNYEPGDGTLAARAGTPIGEMACKVAGGGHHLSPRLRHDPQATFGGILAAGRSGIDRIRFGPMRHQVLGTRIALADGTVAVSGGRLVKNVTGYDLHRLHCGSRGTLGVILEACLRLYPAPDTGSWLSAGFQQVEDALEAAERIRTGPLCPWGLVIEESGGDDNRAPWTLHLELAGYEAVLLEERSWARNLLCAMGGDDATPLAAGALDHLADEPCPVLAVTCLPSALERTRRVIAEMVPGHQVLHPALAGVSVRAGSHPIEGGAWVRLCEQLAALDARIIACSHIAKEPEAGGMERTWSQRLREALDPTAMFSPAREVR